MSNTFRNRVLPLGKESDDSVFLRQNTLLQRHVPFSAATLWRLVKAGRFPKPIKLTEQITAWRHSDIEEWAEDPKGYSANRQGGR